MSGVIRALCAVCLLATALTPPAAAQGAGQSPMAVVIDGSGSMWGEVPGDKRQKIEAIRGVLKSVLGRAPATAQTGLFAFGHRRRGDCSDVEQILAPGEPVSKATAALDQIDPKGKGPLAEALKQAGAALPAGKGGSIVVVHDGPDNCQQDVCQAVNDVLTQRPGVSLTFVSIGLSRTDLARFSCVVKAPGGQVMPVDSFASLEGAIDAAMAPLLVPGAGVATPSGDVKERKNKIELTARLSADGPRVGDPVHWRIYKSGAGTGAKPVADQMISAFNGALEPGDYEADIEFGEVTKRVPFSVSAQGTAVVQANLDAGIADVKAGTEADGSTLPGGLTTVIAKAGAEDSWNPLVMTSRRNVSLALPAGDYVAVTTGALVRYETPFTVKAGERKAVELAIKAGSLSVTASDSAGGPPLSPVTFSMAVDDPYAPGGMRDVIRQTATNAEFVLPAGSYTVTARYGQAEGRQRISLNGAGRQQVNIVIASALLELSARVNASYTGPPPQFTITALGDPSRRIAIEGAQSSVALKPGRYSVTATIGGANVLSKTDLDLQQGAKTRAEFDLRAGDIKLAVVPVERAYAASPFWMVKAQSGEMVWQGSGRDTRILLAPGKYTALAEVKENRYETTFEARPDESTTVSVNAN